MGRCFLFKSRWKILLLSITPTFAIEQAEVALHRPAVKKQWKTKNGTFQVKQKQPVQKDQKKDQMDGTSPELEEATFVKNRFLRCSSLL